MKLLLFSLQCFLQPQYQLSLPKDFVKIFRQMLPGKQLHFKKKLTYGERKAAAYEPKNRCILDE